MICEFVAEYLAETLAVTVECVKTIAEAEQAIVHQRWDLAIIQVTASRQRGFNLASRAANRDMAVLLMSGHPEIIAKLEDYGWPHITKPFSLDDLRAQALRTIAETGTNVRRVKAAAARMAGSIESSSQEMSLSQHATAEINNEPSTRTPEIEALVNRVAASAGAQGFDSDAARPAKGQVPSAGIAAPDPATSSPPRRGIRFMLHTEGAEAARDGCDAAANPYAPGTMESIGWLEGWARATMTHP